jgi:iron uptake system EfeUOB component EfeO/EfeM
MSDKESVFVSVTRSEIDDVIVALDAASKMQAELQRRSSGSDWLGFEDIINSVMAEKTETYRRLLAVFKAAREEKPCPTDTDIDPAT